MDFLLSNRLETHAVRQQWSEVNFGFNVTFKYKYITFKTIK